MKNENETENVKVIEEKRPGSSAWLAGFGGGVGANNEPTEDFEY